MLRVLVFFISFLAVWVKSLTPSGARTIAAETIALRKQIITLAHHHKFSPSLTTSDRFYVNREKHFPDSKGRYVLWLDIMGIKNIFIKNDKTPTVHVVQLHKCYEAVAKQTHTKYYPLIDGFYLVSNDLATLLEDTEKFMLKISNWFIDTITNEYCFLVRGGIRYGNIIIGTDIQNELPQV